MHGACLRCDLDILVHLAFPDEIKVEFTAVCQDDLFCLLFVDKEFAVVEGERLASLNVDTRFISLDRMMNLVSLALYVKDKRPGLALDIAAQVVVVLKLKLRGKCDFNGQF